METLHVVKGILSLKIRAIYEVGMTGVPVYNVNNNCSTGSTAILMARNFVQGGLYDCVMALGFEKM